LTGSEPVLAGSGARPGLLHTKSKILQIRLFFPDKRFISGFSIISRMPRGPSINHMMLYIKGIFWACLSNVFPSFYHRATLRSRKTDIPASSGYTTNNTRCQRAQQEDRISAVQEHGRIYHQTFQSGGIKSKNTIGCNEFDDRQFHLEVLCGERGFGFPICSGNQRC